MTLTGIVKAYLKSLADLAKTSGIALAAWPLGLWSFAYLGKLEQGGVAAAVWVAVFWQTMSLVLAIWALCLLALYAKETPDGRAYWREEGSARDLIWAVVDKTFSPILLFMWSLPVLFAILIAARIIVAAVG